MFIIEKLWILHLKELWKLFMLHFLLFGLRPCRWQQSMVAIYIGISFSFSLPQPKILITSSQALTFLFQSCNNLLCNAHCSFWSSHHSLRDPPDPQRSLYTLWVSHYSKWRLPHLMFSPPTPSPLGKWNYNTILLYYYYHYSLNVIWQGASESELRTSEGLRVPLMK